MKSTALIKLLGACSTMAFIFPGVACAQQAVASDQAANEPDEVTKEIIVTGSSIRGAPPVGSTLIQLGRGEIEKSPAPTTDQIIKEIPQIFNFGVTDSSRSQSGGGYNASLVNSINIRGIAPYATLTLINGRRAVPQGTIGSVVDPSNIPAIALERIEVIADGASAVYGSDAVAGVANLILRRDYDGVGTDVQYGLGDDYNTFTVSGIVGKSWSTGRFTLSGQHAYRSALNASDRSFAGADLSGRGGTDYRSSQCSPGNILVGGTSYAIPTGGATPTNLVAGTQNKCDTFDQNDINPQQEINSATLTFDQELTDNISLFVDGLYARRDGRKQTATATTTMEVPESNAFFVAPQGATLPNCTSPAFAGQRCVNVEYSFENDFGAKNSYQTVSSEAWQLSGGFDVDLGGNWHANLYTTYGENADDFKQLGTVINPPALNAALASSNPATAFNPFGTSTNSQAVVNSILDGQFLIDGQSKLSDSGIKVDGTLFSLPGGDVKFAAGGEYTWLNVDSGLARGGFRPPRSVHSRNVKSAYAELLVPIFGPDNAMSGIQSLTLDVAGRVDDYSDFGTTTNPKIGVNWSPVKDVRVHGSYGTSFRAPLLAQMFDATGVTTGVLVQNYFDPQANGGAGGTIRAVTITGSAQDLEPETARSWSFGVDYTPSSLPGALFSLNYFDLVYKGQVAGYTSDLSVLQNETLFSSIIQRGAAAQTTIANLVSQLDAGTALLTGSGTRADVLAATVVVDGRPLNLGTTIARGIDFGVVVPWRTENSGTFTFAVRGTRFLAYKVAYTPGGDILNRLGTYDTPLKLQARGSVSWEKGPWNVNTWVNYQDDYVNDRGGVSQKVKSRTTVDMAVAYDFSGVFGFAKSFRLGLNVTNLFDTDPPFYNVAPTDTSPGGYDPNNANAIGRVVSFSLGTQF